MIIHILEIVAGDDRFLMNGDTLLAEFAVETEGARHFGQLIRTSTDALIVRMPRLTPLNRSLTLKLVHAAFLAAGGVEPEQPKIDLSDNEKWRVRSRRKIY